jgi:hypothetical protein
MNKLRFAIRSILILLGAAAGLVKIIRMPQELEFFQAIGLSELGFGAVSMLPALMSGWIFRDTARSKSPPVDFGSQGGPE